MRLRPVETGQRLIRFRVLIRGELVRDIWASSLEELDEQLLPFISTGDYVILNMSNTDGKINRNTLL